MKNKKTLQLNLKKQWFDMIASGEKKEEYRDLKQYYFDRLFDGFDSNEWTGDIEDFDSFKDYDTVTFSNGYSKDRRQMVVEFDSIHISIGAEEWGANDRYCFIIGLGDILSKNF